MSSNPLDVTGASGLTALRTGRSAAGRNTLDATPQQVEQLSQEFEAMLLLNMIKQMRQSMLSQDEEGGGYGAETMTETVDLELARHLAKQGGVGLARVMEDAFKKQMGDGPSAPAPAGAAPVAPAPASRFTARPSAAAALSGETSGAGEAQSDIGLPFDGRVSSPFGWRRDPLNGLRKFHAGVDLPAAYGREVPAAAAGQVVFAGEQGGYGMTILVEHSGGLQSRYAHLSVTDVRVGDRVEAGQIIGRVGQTGRATGPHLHFELVRDGRRLDPSSVPARTASLKVDQRAADLEDGHMRVGLPVGGDSDED